ncbi:hypothetical protein LMG23994_06633 [Cupriavidus pinatubonensis]|uniref:Uncharacterized protein n=1 Tax=Cupriavidus pinatubonensis TaxID=248026 RepID=A0ABM8Y350_9BURK|nr:hypothetical protein LMG23994_06633 [Cupriavidus pinatubonensis]
MTHEALLQGNDGADRFNEDNQEPTDEWLVQGDSLVVKMVRRYGFHCSCTKAFGLYWSAGRRASRRLIWPASVNDDNGLRRKLAV